MMVGFNTLLLAKITEHPILATLALVLVPLLATLLHDIQTWHRMPPGPTPLPFLGNKPSIPAQKPWLQFAKWAEDYGPIYTLWIGRRPTVVLSDPAIAVELLEKRSAKYSSRPRMVAMGELYNANASILVQPYGKEWTVRRRLLHHAMTPRALRLYKPIQEAEATRLCFALLAQPERYEGLIERFTSSVVFCVAYGHRIDSLKAEVIRQRFEFMHYMASLNVPGKYLCETFPVLKHVPDFLAPWKVQIREMGKREADANLALWEQVKLDISTAKAEGRESKVPESLTKLILELREKEHIPLSDQQLSYTPASLFGAGSDTTASTLCTAVLALVTHPAALLRAQEELDAVIGNTRLPTFEDEADLPYLRALVKEVLRWRPVAVLGGTPRATTADDEYEGYRIPLGTTVLSNFWAMNLNDDYYPHPHVFDPLRFLPLTSVEPLSDADARVYEATYRGRKSFPGKSGLNVFGVGRRICPGANLAENSLFIALGRLIWSFDITAKPGRRYDTHAYTEGFNIRPQPFPAEITMRSEEHREVLAREMQGAEAYLEKYTAFAE